MLNSVKGKKERIGRMLEMNSNDRTDIEQAPRRAMRPAVVGSLGTTRTRLSDRISFQRAGYVLP